MKKGLKNNSIFLILIFFCSLILLPYNMIITKADTESNLAENIVGNTIENVVENETDNTVGNTVEDIPVNLSEDAIDNSSNNEAVVLSEASLEATLWDTNQYAAGTGTALSDTGVEIAGWQAETNKYLQIEPTVPADGNTYFVSVILPDEFYIVASELALQAGYQSVDFTKNEDIVINDSTTLVLNKYSGTAKYTLNNMGVSGTLQLELGYDVRLWDKQANSSITASGIYPIIVTLSKQDSSGNVTELNRVYVSKVTSGTKFAETMSMSGKIEGESSTSSGTVTVPKDKKVTVSNGITNNSGTARYKFYPNVAIKINLPYYTHTDGTKYYIPFDIDTLKSPGISCSSYTIDSSLLESDGIINVNATNAYWYTGKVAEFDVGPLSDELLALDVNEYSFKNGKITIKAEGKNGATGISYSSTSILTINYQKEVLENVKLSGIDRGVTIVERPENVVSILGGFHLSNSGTGDSCAKTINIEFDTENTNKIRVTTYNTFADTVQEYILINYTLVDENGEKVYLDADGNRVAEGTEGAIGEWTYNMKNTYYGSTSKANLRNKFVRSMLPEEQRSYYFKTLNYTIQEIEAQASLVATSASASLTSAGNFFGYVDDVNGAHGDVIYNRIVVKSENTNIADLTRTGKTTLQTTSNPTYTIDTLSMSQTNIQAGESLTVSGRINSVEYPYGNSTWIKGITIAAILPKDISINEQSIAIKNVTGSLITGYSMTSEDLGDGNKLWKIKLPEDVYIGGPSESLGRLDVGLYINFSMQLNTSYTMNTVTLYAKDIFFAAAYNQSNAASGSYSWSKYTDTYDLNENGKTTDSIAGARSTTTTSCQIVSGTATLDVNDSITVERQGQVSQESNEEYLLSDQDIVNYNLDIGCFSGGRAEDVAYYIPIPKKTSEIDGVIIENSSTGMFDFVLKEPASFSGTDIFNIQYSFEDGLTYNEAQEVATWYTVDDIEDDETLNIQDVTMIKLTVKGEGIQNGDKTRISIKLLYDGNQYMEETGLKNIWHSGGFFKHINGEKESAGNFTTTGITVTIKNTIECDEITLTAAQNMNPTISGNVNEVVVDKSLFKTFVNAHDFSITSVETYNVTLQTREYMLANTDMGSADANKTFAVTVKTENGEESDILSTMTSENPSNVGKSNKSDSPEFTYKIYNANALSDNTQTRYIVVTFVSDNGLTIKQKININREIAGAVDPKSAIVVGKRYLTYDDTTTEISISQNSAFTAQFVTEYIPDNYLEQSFEFSEKLPNGTTLIIGNLTDSSNPTFWYYKVGVFGKSSFDFTEFNLMGKTSENKYELPTGIDVIEEKILLIVDFSESTSYLDENSYSIKMRLGGSANITEFLTEEMYFSTKTTSSFTLGDISNINFGDKFNVNYSASISSGAESKYEGRKLSLVLKAPDNIMPDTSLLVNDSTTYYLNSNNEYIVPLGDVEDISTQIGLVMSSNMQLNTNTSYAFEASLWISATANSDAPKLGEMITTKNFSVSSVALQTPSLKVKNMSARVIHRENLSQMLSATFECLEIDNCTATVEVQQKIGNAYQKLTDKLNQVNNTTVHNMGSFDIDVTNGTNQIDFYLSTTTQNNTYRIVFKVFDSEGTLLLDVPYNFVVID